MARYIDADEYCRLEGCPKPWKDGDDCGVCMIQDCKTLDVQPVKHGKWVANGISGSMLYACSNCEFPCGAYSFNYCPKCGAKMDKKKGD